MPPFSLGSLSGCCAVSLPPISFIFASRLPFIIHGLPFIAVTKISCQKAPWLWRPTVATAISHMEWRLERKHTRHECQESFPITPAASLFRPSVIIGKPFSLYSTSSLPCGIAPMAQFHTHPFLVVSLILYLLYPFHFSSIVFATSDIFRKGTSCVANAKLGIMDAFQKIFLYVHGI